MLDVSRMAYVTEHYAQLQGLRLVPLGIPFVASAFWRTGLLPWRFGDASHARAWFFLSFAVALALSVLIGRLYRRWFGAMPPRASRSGAVTLATCFVGVVAFAWRSPPPSPLFVPAVFVGLAFGRLGCVEHGLRRHYIGLAAACWLFAITPALGVPPPARRVALDFLIGLGLIVAGLGDHAVLQRLLYTPEGVLDDRAA
jgi:hypothetical protein